MEKESRQDVGSGECDWRAPKEPSHGGRKLEYVSDIVRVQVCQNHRLCSGKSWIERGH